MIKYKFISTAYDLKLDGRKNKGIKLLDNLRVSNSENKIIEMFHPFFENAIGTLEYKYLLSNPYFYAEGEIQDETIFFDDNKGLDFLDDFMKKVQVISNLLWLVKDNSIHTETGYLQFEKKGLDAKFHSNGRSVMFRNTEGLRKELTFNTEELKFPEIFFSNYFHPLSAVKNESFENDPVDTPQVYEGSRIERAFYLIQTARAQGYLPERISIFTSLLETLLSTSSNEVTHKLKERVAWLLGKNFEIREEIFNDMGVIYGIRSHHVHNSTVPKNANTQEKLIGYSRLLETYVRDTLVKILTEESIYTFYQKNDKGKYDDSELDNFFKTLCLGKEI